MHVVLQPSTPISITCLVSADACCVANDVGQFLLLHVVLQPNDDMSFC